jgi:hypothetical protein
MNFRSRVPSTRSILETSVLRGQARGAGKAAKHALFARPVAFLAGIARWTGEINEYQTSTRWKVLGPPLDRHARGVAVTAAFRRVNTIGVSALTALSVLSMSGRPSAATAH